MLVLGVSQNTLTFYPEDPARVDRTRLGINIPQRNPSLNPNNIIPDMTFGGNVPNAFKPPHLVDPGVVKESPVPHRYVRDERG